MHEPWDSFLEDGAAPGHGVEIYTRDEELVESVTAFLTAGFEADAAGVVIATPDHVEAIRAAVGASGTLICADADETLAALFQDGMLSPERFEQIVGGLLDEAQLSRTGAPRAFGEMVDRLRLRGRAEAMALEELWEEERRRRPFSLLCAYRLDVFDPAMQDGPLQQICNVHSHVMPAHDLPRFNNAVDCALTEVLGPRVTRDVYYIVDRPLRARRVPVAQDALRWLVASFPAEAPEVLAAARGYYESSGRRSSAG